MRKLLFIVIVGLSTLAQAGPIQAAQKSGGGAFSQPSQVQPRNIKPKSSTKKRPKAVKRKKKVNKRKVTATNSSSDGKYSVRANLVHNNTGQTCYSATIKFAVRNGKGSYQIGFGPLLGGRVSGRKLIISTLRISTYFNRKWNGSAKLPQRAGIVTSGSMRAVDPRGKTCKWTLAVSRR